jgi:hypothetical protein
MAREAGAIHIHGKPKEFAIVGNDNIKAFEALVRADERALAAPVQEPVGKIESSDFGNCVQFFSGKMPPVGSWLYTTPPNVATPLAAITQEELQDLKRSEREGWRYADELEQERKRLTARSAWVGLTDEAIWSEYQTLWPFHPAEESRLAKDIAKFARAIEAKLKEKNT